MKTTIYYTSILALTVIAPVSGSAHHAFTGVYDMQNVTEVSGELTEVLWRNPHVRFSIRDSAGETWEVETNSVSIIGRMDISPDIMGVGDNITVAGHTARNGSLEMWINHILLSDGREVVTRPGVDPYFTDSTLGSAEVWLAEGSATSEADAQELGIFRVWSTHFTGPTRSLFDGNLPLTPAAAEKRRQFDPIRDDMIGDCVLKGMPMIMQQPYPVEFVDEGGVILFRIEEYDAVRTIVMDSNVGLESTPTRLGRSRGHWESDELHVETTNIEWPYFDASGTPQSLDIELYERFFLSEDGSQLNYHLTATDPSTFTETIELDKAWMWRPGETVRPYECTPSE